MGKMKSTKGIARQWCADIMKHGVCEGEQRLVRHLVFVILNSWKEKASQAAIVNGTSVVIEFSQVYLQNKEKAQGAIVAIIELIRTIGSGEMKDVDCRRLN